jgi:hypothetical protein
MPTLSAAASSGFVRWNLEEKQAITARSNCGTSRSITLGMMDSKPPLTSPKHPARKRRPTAAQARAATVDYAVERALIAILESAPGSDETLDFAFRRKEHAVGAMFAALPTQEARLLHRRLSQPIAGDRLAELFHRLVVDRRVRLLAFLGDARRREALARMGR